MEEKFFAGLHAGFLVHRLSRMAGTEVLDTSPAHWKVTAIDNDCVECIDVTVQPHPVNGQPGAIFRDRDGKVLNTLALDILDGRIRTIRAVINPDKLGHLGPVADPWAVLREANQVRRHAH